MVSGWYYSNVLSTGGIRMASTVRNALYDRIRKHLPRSRDPVLVIIKGHLLIEERLHAIIESALRDPSRLQDARLTVHQALCVCEAMLGRENSGPLRVARRLNEVRNRLAHHLEPGDVNELVDSVIHAYNSDTSVVPSSQNERIRWLKNTILMASAELEGYRKARVHIREEMEQQPRESCGVMNRSS